MASRGQMNASFYVFEHPAHSTLAHCHVSIIQQAYLSSVKLPSYIFLNDERIGTLIQGNNEVKAPYPRRRPWGYGLQLLESRQRCRSIIFLSKFEMETISKASLVRKTIASRSTLDTGPCHRDSKAPSRWQIHCELSSQKWLRYALLNMTRTLLELTAPDRSSTRPAKFLKEISCEKHFYSHEKGYNAQLISKHQKRAYGFGSDFSTFDTPRSER